MIRNHNISLKLKILVSALAIMSLTYADNTELFNQAMSIGNQNQFNLNLNQSSSIDSYGKSNKFTDDVANKANAGNANAKNMYNGASNDPNYLYNNGTQSIRDCSTQTDPRCTTLNKYGDKDTQTQIQAYTQGLSTRYLISVTPDPSDQACSIVKHKSPVNQSTATCIAGSKLQTECHNITTPYIKSFECNEQTGQCTTYKNMYNCIQVRPFKPGDCIQYTMYAHYGSCNVNTYSCNVPSTFHTPGCGGSHGRDYKCGTCIADGGQDGCWGQWCTQYSSPQLALYMCKYYSYSKGCPDAN